MALAMGAQVGETVRIDMLWVNRPSAIVPLTDNSNYDRYQVIKYHWIIYPYKSYDFRLGNMAIRPNIGYVFNTYRQYETATVISFKDTYVSGEEISDKSGTTGFVRTWNGLDSHPVCGYLRNPVLPRKYNWSMSTTRLDLAYRDNSAFNSFLDGSDLPIISTNGYALDGSGPVTSAFASTCNIVGAVEPYSFRMMDYDAQYPNSSILSKYYTTTPLSVYGDGRLKILRPDQFDTTESVLVVMDTVNSNTNTITINNVVNNFPTPTSTQTQTPTSTSTKGPFVVTATSTKTLTPTQTTTQAPTPTKPAPTPTPSSTPVVSGSLITIRDLNNPSYSFKNISNDVKTRFLQGVGSVNKPYGIGKYAVTNYEYAEFLNAIGQNNANNVYIPEYTRITRSGSAGSYTYAVASGHNNTPVTYISWVSAARYCNWLHKNKPNDPSGVAVNTGAYDLTKTEITRAKDAKYWIPSIDEWIKAGFYDPQTGGYYAYGTKNNSPPTKNLDALSTNGAVYDRIEIS